MVRRVVLAVVVVALLGACGSTASTLSPSGPTLSVTDPRHGHEVTVRCDGISEADCVALADQILAYLPADAASVEGVSIEPLADAPPGSRIAARVTVDHEMAFQSGEQPYRVIQADDGAEFQIEIILDE
jgi:hypothetical protein